MKFNLWVAAFMLAVAGETTGAPAQGPVDWPKTIDCPPGRVYLDIRRGEAREEYCELRLPGALKVQDGPSRWWYGQGHFGEEGTYQNGRKVGRWKECNQYDQCKDRTYESVYPQERARGAKPEIPVSFSRGKYIFDFSSCRSSWVTRQTNESFLELNIGGGLVRCQVTYIPSAETDRPGRSEGAYLCEIPYSVGVRELDSLDLRTELPKIGLPQFCRKNDPPVTVAMPNGEPAQAFAIWANQSFVDITNKETRVWTTLANIIDVECAAINPQRSGVTLLIVRLNEYAERLVLERAGKDELKADACSGRFPLSTINTTRDGSGRSLFVYGLSANRTTAERQRACISSQITLQPTCTSR